jgi:hypothetical protein
VENAFIFFIISLMNNPDNYAGGSHEMRHDRPHDPDSNYELPLEDA